jgi:hypothetical protein
MGFYACNVFNYFIEEKNLLKILILLDKKKLKDPRVWSTIDNTAATCKNFLSCF